VAACKFTPLPYTPPNLPKFSIKKTDLPVTCKLSQPGRGSIAEAKFYNVAAPPLPLTVSSSGQTFIIPNTVGDGRVEVRIKGGPPDPTLPIDVAEDCDASQVILTVTDSGSKAAAADVAVQ
jgi:hypothetical protein